MRMQFSDFTSDLCRQDHFPFRFACSEPPDDFSKREVFDIENFNVINAFNGFPENGWLLQQRQSVADPESGSEGEYCESR